MQTIKDWEDERFVREASDEIAAIPTAEPERTLALVPVEAPRDLLALRGRITAGLGVQLLLDRVTTQTFVTVAVGGRTETFEVQPGDANDAFEHPYCYGATLPIR